MLLPLLLITGGLAAATPGADLSARELAGLGVTTDRAWLLEQAHARVRERPDDGAAGLRLEATVREAAQLAHRSASRSRRADDYEHAVALYDLYLSTWPSSALAYRYTWSRAELLFDMGAYEEAAGGYHAVVRMSDAGQYRFSAARNEMLAWERVAAAQDEGGRHFAQRKLLEAADRYVLLTVHVQNEKVRALRADAAFKAFVVAAEQDAAPEAKARAFDLLRMGDDAAPHARAAARILLDKTARWQGAAAAVELACSLRRDALVAADDDARRDLDERCAAR